MLDSNLGRGVALAGSILAFAWIVVSAEGARVWFAVFAALVSVSFAGMLAPKKVTMKKKGGSSMGDAESATGLLRRRSVDPY